MIEFHQEANGGAVRPATKAVVEAFPRADGEGGRLFIVKRAASLELAACFLELHAAANHLNDICSCDQIINEILRNKSGHICITLPMPVRVLACFYYS